MISRKLFVGIVLVIVVTIALIGSSLVSEPAPSADDSADNDPRIVDWRHVHGLGLDPADHDILYIATHGDFYHSIGDGPPVKVDKIRADYMAFNAPPVSGIPLYASGHPSTGGNTGLIKSDDGGITWESVSKVLEPPVDFHPDQHDAEHQWYQNARAHRRDQRELSGEGKARPRAQDVSQRNRPDERERYVEILAEHVRPGRDPVNKERTEQQCHRG